MNNLLSSSDHYKMNATTKQFRTELAQDGDYQGYEEFNLASAASAYAEKLGYARLIAELRNLADEYERKVAPALMVLQP